MTREEAIERIYNISYGNIVDRDDLIAFGVAIEALAGLQPTCNQLATDCISRRAAIAEFSCCELTPDGGIDVNYAIDFLMNMPSVQPEVRTPMSSADCISRQDFDKFLEDAEKEAVKNRRHVFASALNTIRGNLKIFPSVQPEIIRCRDCVHNK